MWKNPAFIGLLGVLVGSIISTGSNYLLAIRKEKAEAAERRLSRVAELKTAARLIGQELLAGQAAATILVEKKRWVSEDITFPLDAWQRDKGVVARELPVKGWHAVAVAVTAVEHLRSLHHTAPPWSEQVSDAIAESSKALSRDIAAGLEALGPYMLDAWEAKNGR